VFSVFVQGYKVYYTVNPTLPMASWESQMVDNNQLTTVSELVPHTIYTVRVQAFTSVGPGPLSVPVLVKTQQGGKTLSLTFPSIVGHLTNQAPLSLSAPYILLGALPCYSFLPFDIIIDL
jgi:hypothetical protein